MKVNRSRSLLFLFCAFLPVLSGYGVIFNRMPPMEDRTTQPIRTYEELEVFAETEFPPGNITTNSKGRVFSTFHPEARPRIKVVEWKNGKAFPYPNQEFSYQTPLSLRTDSKNRLWVLDYGFHGLFQAKFFVFDLNTNKLLFKYEFPRSVAGIGSMLNDFYITKNAKFAFISDTSAVRKSPGIVVLDIEKKESKRVLSNHFSTKSTDYSTFNNGEMVKVLFVPLKLGVDSIALGPKDEWLYYKPLNGGTLYKIKVSDLISLGKKEGDLEKKVLEVGKTTQSDGLAIDGKGNIYLTDIENRAITVFTPEGKLLTLFKDKRIRWPDGLSLAPGNEIYLTDSALMDALNFKSHKKIKSKGPYKIYRFKTLE